MSIEGSSRLRMWCLSQEEEEEAEVETFTLRKRSAASLDKVTL